MTQFNDIPKNPDGTLQDVKLFAPNREGATALQGRMASVGYTSIKAERIDNGWLVSATISQGTAIEPSKAPSALACRPTVTE